VAAHPPLVTRDYLRQLPWLLAGAGFVLGLFQLALVPEPARWWLWLGLIVGGAGLGIYGKYRARFAVAQGLAVIVMTIWFFAILCAAPAALLVQGMGRADLAWPVFLMVMVNAGGFAGVGVWRAQRAWREARAAGRWEQQLAQYADLASRRLTNVRAQAPAPSSVHVAFWPAIGVNLPLVAVAVLGEGGERWLIGAVLLMLMPLVAWLTLRFAARLPIYLNLRRYERAHGFRFASDEADALAQVRSRFRLRGLCRPEDRVAPASAERTARRPRGRR